MGRDPLVLSESIGARRSFVFDAMTYLTVAELKAVGEEIMAIIDRYADRLADHSKRPAGSSPVSVIATGHPLAPTPAGN